METQLITGEGIQGVFEEVLRSERALIISAIIKEPYTDSVLRMVMEGRALVITCRCLENDLYRLVLRLAGPPRRRSGILSIVRSRYGIYTATSLALFTAAVIILAGPLGLAALAAALGIAYLVVRRILRRRSESAGVGRWINNIKFTPGPGDPGHVGVRLYATGFKAWVGTADMAPDSWRVQLNALVQLDVGVAAKLFERAWSGAEPY